MKKILSGILFSILLSSTLLAVFNIRSVKAAETVYINADGSISPPEAPISSLDNITYTLTGNVADSIVVERSNIVVDGAGYIVEGDGTANGFSLQDTVNVTVKDVVIVGCFDGIQLFNSSGNTIIGNSVMANIYEGVGLYYSSDNIITNNNLMNNQVGIGCYDSSSNSIFHNNFTDNVAQAYAESSANVWDDGYPLGGNYWSDHKGADNYRGSSQNEPGSDGITDSPRTIDQSNVDHFPLMKPYAGSHDIGLRAVFSKTIFPSDYNLTVTANVTIVNYGEQTETFNFTFQMPPSTQEQRITLASRGSNAFGFSWNTTGYGKGKYTISSHVDIVPSETDTTDNTFTVDVTLTILGDVSGDFKVDLNDIVSILDSFGSTVGRPRYNPNMDIDDNGKIDLNDIIVDLDHFGQQSP